MLRVKYLSDLVKRKKQMEEEKLQAEQVADQTNERKDLTSEEIQAT